MARRSRQKPKVEVLLTKSAQFDSIIASEQADGGSPAPEEGS